MTKVEITTGKIITITEIFPHLHASPHPLIDLRSPKEYEKGHILNAINIPLLNNEERHEIGILYKQQGKEIATHQGIILFAAKAEKFLQQIETQSPQKNLTLYCWRGGMRSRMVAQWLATMGYTINLIKGGYKNFRRQTLTLLEKCYLHPFVVLCGKTGSGKTSMIEICIQQKLPAIDLEGHAKHRGSAFGDLAQPSSPATPQQFENDLAYHYFIYKDAKRIAIEFESRIGPIILSPAFRKNILSSPMILLNRDFTERCHALVECYSPHWSTKDETIFIANMEMLRPLLERACFEEIISAARKKDLIKACELLLIHRYDKCYEKSLKRHADKIVAEFDFTLQKDLILEKITNLTQIP